MGNQTPFYQSHLNAKGKMVDFAGWDMPIHYGSQLEEHKIVRQSAGMFDVSHMTIVDVTGTEAKAFLQKLLANNVDKLKDAGKALYSCMLDEDAGIIDDLIVYYMRDDYYRVVVNAATHDKDLAWMQKRIAGFDARLDEQQGTAMLAVQGPQARQKVLSLLPAVDREGVEALKAFFAYQNDKGLFIGRTGYTGEDGFEIMMPADQAASWWDQLLEVGVQPCGLGARDTLRLEAGMNLYGTDMDESKHPYNSGLAWTVALEPEDRDFIGRSALLEKKQSNNEQFVGLLLEDKGMLRNHLKVITAEGAEGEITSGSFSPTLGKAIALARIPKTAAKQCEVEIRNKRVPVRIVKPVFVRNGKACVE